MTRPHSASNKVWDAVNLFIALPLLALALYLSWRGSLRGRLLLGGLLFFLFYAYLGYAMSVALNPFFLVYVAIFALSAVAFFLNLAALDVERLPERIAPRLPHRFFIGYMLAISVVLLALWTQRVIAILSANQFPPELAGLTTLGSQALDLGLLVPLALAAAILLWRRSPWGYLLLSVATTVGLLMLICIPLWVTVPLVQSGNLSPAQTASCCCHACWGRRWPGSFSAAQRTMAKRASTDRETYGAPLAPRMR